MTTSAHHRQPHPREPAPCTSGDSLASVYVDMAASLDAVQAAVAQLPMPVGVNKVGIDDRSITDTFGCRIAIDLTGAFNETVEGHTIARRYAQRLSALLGVPAVALYDLLRTDPTKFLC